MFKLIMLTSCLLFVSCATTMPGKDIDTGSKRVSATIVPIMDLSNDRVQMHQFSIKNNTNEWIEFEGAEIEGSKDVLVLVGNRISSWVEACTLEKKVSDYNTGLLLGSLAIAGAVVSGSSHQGTSSTGAIVALGSISVLGVKSYRDSKKKVEFQKAFPKKHIFRSFVVPPKKVIQRWILVENPQQENFSLKLKSSAGDDIALQIMEDRSEKPKRSQGAIL